MRPSKQTTYAADFRLITQRLHIQALSGISTTWRNLNNQGELCRIDTAWFHQDLVFPTEGFQYSIGYPGHPDIQDRNALFSWGWK